MVLLPPAPGRDRAEDHQAEPGDRCDESAEVVARKPGLGTVERGFDGARNDPEGAEDDGQGGAQARPQPWVDDRRADEHCQRNEPGDEVVGDTRPGLGLHEAVVDEMEGDQAEPAQRDQRLGARRSHAIAYTLPLARLVHGDTHRSSVSPSTGELNAGGR